MHTATRSITMQLTRNLLKRHWAHRVVRRNGSVITASGIALDAVVPTMHQPHNMAVKSVQVSQMCYAEKHRICEMFTNLVKAMVIYQPSDPLRFIAWYLKHRRHVDVPKVILLAAPEIRSSIDIAYVALNVAKCTGAVTVDRRNVKLRYAKKRGNNECSTNFVTKLIEYMRAKGTSKRGWILLDIPNSKEESQRMISLGILPTHTILLNAAIPNEDQINFDKFDQRKKSLKFEIQMSFQSTLKELQVYDKSINEITELCLEQILYRKPPSTPFTPRITIIGPQGSRCFATASVISKAFNIVHVDFNQILARKITNDGIEIPQETIRSRLKKRITENDCIEKGYVLTGFPRSRNDFEWLDSTEVAPNRVIFFAIDMQDLYARLVNRCINKNTNVVMSLEQAAFQLKAGTLKFEHVERYPLDLKKLFSEFKTYCHQLKDMLYYCGDNCSIVPVDGRSCDNVSACVSSGSPAAPGPRPQNRRPSRLTEGLYESMLRSYRCVDGDDDHEGRTTWTTPVAAAAVLSDDAQRLLCALERSRVPESAEYPVVVGQL